MNRHRITVAAIFALLVISLVLPASFTPVHADHEEESKIAPRILHQVPPEYPDAERKAGVEGYVLLAVTIEKDGTVGEITITKDVPKHPAFAKSAIAAVKEWKWAPAKDGDEPVAMKVHVPFEFRLDGDGDIKTKKPKKEKKS